MILSDYAQPFDAIKDFENALCEYTGAKHAITTDCCTHAIELCFRLQPEIEHVEFPAHTYLSVIMTMHKLGIAYTLTPDDWRNEYQFKGSNIYDSARFFSKNMYVPGTVKTLSFGRTKPLQLGTGGCILLDDDYMAEKLYRMRYDGRAIHEYDPWIKQKIFEVGYHYYMRPETAVLGLNKLANREFTNQKKEFYNYPDCRNIQII